jgi:hypothetical protein
MNASEDDKFRYKFTFIDTGREKGFVTHYRPRHPPLSAEVRSVFTYLGLKEFHQCPEFDFEACHYRTLQLFETDMVTQISLGGTWGAYVMEVFFIVLAAIVGTGAVFFLFVIEPRWKIYDYDPRDPGPFSRVVNEPFPDPGALRPHFENDVVLTRVVGHLEAEIIIRPDFAY